MGPDRYTAIAAGAGGLLGAKHAPATTTLGVLVAIEAFNQWAESTSPGMAGGNGPYPIEKSIMDVAVAFGAYWLVDTFL
jgi:hypothetical protein